MWIETALLYAWIRVCLRGAGSPLCLCLEQRNCAGQRSQPAALLDSGAACPSADCNHPSSSGEARGAPEPRGG